MQLRNQPQEIAQVNPEEMHWVVELAEPFLFYETDLRSLPLKVYSTSVGAALKRGWCLGP